MRILRILSPHPSNLHALARLLPSAACHVLLQQGHHLVTALLFRELQGSLADPELRVCMCVCVRARAL
jgi:hypothetical protein